LTIFSAIEIEANKGGATNLNAGTQIIYERIEQKIFLLTPLLSSCSWNFSGGSKQSRPSQTSFSGEVVFIQWGG